MTSWSIITPSFKQLDWLRCCISSVYDQASSTVPVEHIIQDGGTPEFDHFAQSLGALPVAPNQWLIEEENYRLQLISEPDQGMYDAINRGFDRARGTLIAHLNCDEQYLEGALLRVSKFFQENPQAHIAVSGVLVLNPQGLPVCARQGLSPQIYHIATDHLPTFTAATFYRRSLIEKPWRRFDTQFRACADALWMIDRIREDIRPKVIQGYTSIFFDTGNNLVLKSTSRKEAQYIYHQMPSWIRWLHPFWRWSHRLQKFLRGEYLTKTFTYSVYIPQNTAPEKKTLTNIPIQGIWWNRLKYSPRKG